VVVQIKIPCPDCNSTDVVRRGYTRSGKQRYLCGNPFCVRITFVTEYDYKGSLPETKETIIKMTMNGSGIRDTARVLGVSTTTVLNTLKKKRMNSQT
jgi:transposase-like protein